MLPKLHQLFLTALISLAFATTAHSAIIGPGESGTVTFTDPVVLDPPAAAGEFTHTYNFGFGMPTTQGQGSVLLNPGPGIGDFAASLLIPGTSSPISIGLNFMFVALNTPNSTPYTLTIMGSLLAGADVGTYDGSISVVPGNTVDAPGTLALSALALVALGVASRRKKF